MFEPPPERLKPRDAAALLLSRRPDLGARRRQRSAARRVADALGGDAAAVEVLAAWLGSRADAEVEELEQVLSDRLQLRLAALSPDERPLATKPGRRAQDALRLGWDGLDSEAIGEALQVLATTATPLPPRVIAQTARTSLATARALAGTGFAQELEDGRLWIQPAGRGFLIAQGPLPDRVSIDLLAALVRAVGVEELPEDSIAELAELAASLGADHPAARATLGIQLAERYRRIDRLEDARRWLRRVGRPNGEGDLRALAALLDLQSGLLDLAEGKVVEAAETLEAARHDLDRAAEEGSPAAATAAHRAAWFAAEARILAGDRGRNLEVLAAAVAHLEGATHPSDRLARAGMALVLGVASLAAGDLGGALRLITEANEDWIDVAGEDDPDRAVFEVARAQTLRSAGRHHEIDEPLETARVLAGGDLDRPMHPVLSVALHDLGVAAADRGDWDTGTILLDEATMLAGSKRPQDRRIQAHFGLTRGLMGLGRGDLDDARRQIDRTEARHIPDLPADGPLAALLKAAAAWTEARRSPERRHLAATRLREAEQTLSELRGPRSLAAAHVRILRRSLGG